MVSIRWGKRLLGQNQTHTCGEETIVTNTQCPVPRHVLYAGSILIWIVLSVPAFARYSSNVQGVLSDPVGTAINGATVQLRNTETGVTARIATSESGNYRFSSFPSDACVLTAEANNFKKSEANFTLDTSETKGINITLAVASAQERITVEVTPPAVDTDDSRLQATLSSDTVRDLPSANRNLWDILAVTPGVVGVGTRLAGEAPGGLPDNFGTRTPQISANGRSYTGNVVMVDGLNVTSPVQNGNIILAPIPDAVFNHGNLGTVDPNLADGTFGKPTSTLNPYYARERSSWA
jgi:hypothetical protein